MTSPEQVLTRIDRALAELRELRAELAGDRTAELTEAEHAQLAELVARRAVRMRRGKVQP